MALRVGLLQWAMLVLVGALGFAAGRETVSSNDEEVLAELARLRAAVEARGASPQPPPEVRCAVAPSTSTPVDMAALRAEVAQALREELGSRTDSTTQPESQPPPPISPQAEAAHQEGLQLIEEAIQHRQWRHEDALSMRRLMLQMSDSQRQEVMRRLIVTLNSGGIKVQVGGPLF